MEISNVIEKLGRAIFEEPPDMSSKRSGSARLVKSIDGPMRREPDFTSVTLWRHEKSPRAS